MSGGAQGYTYLLYFNERHPFPHVVWLSIDSPLGSGEKTIITGLAVPNKKQKKHQYGRRGSRI